MQRNAKMKPPNGEMISMPLFFWSDDHAHLGISDGGFDFLHLQWCSAETVAVAEEVDSISFPDSSL
jgi:hypothetical protein